MSKVYGVADKAWQPVVGCEPTMPCARRCWARRTVARIVKCQEPVSPARAAIFQVALTADGKQWSGETFLDKAHLTDPLKWRKPAVIATGFHGDIGRLPDDGVMEVICTIDRCPQHIFMLLTKQPAALVEVFKWPREYGDKYPQKNVTIGCSVMFQSEADMMREPMAKLAALGWRTHVWYEPAIGPVEWAGWEFVERIIYGGESGSEARANDLAWARNTLAFCRRHDLAFWMKQVGASGSVKSRKGDGLDEIPEDLRVREEARSRG